MQRTSIFDFERFCRSPVKPPKEQWIDAWAEAHREQRPHCIFNHPMWPTERFIFFDPLEVLL